MRAGKLDRVIAIQRAAHVPNDAGTPVATWGNLATLRAELVAPRAAHERIAAQGAVDRAAVVFRTRFLAGVTNADRIVFEGRAYGLKDVTVLGRNRGLELTAEALG